MNFNENVMKRKLSYRHYFLLGKLLGQISSVGIKDALDKEVARQSLCLSTREQYMNVMHYFEQYDISPITASNIINWMIHWGVTEEGFDFWHGKSKLPQLLVEEEL